MDYVNQHLSEFRTILDRLDQNKISQVINILRATKDRQGRLFFVGVGGSAANCSHAVNDFRKICKIESYAVTDNISEVTARTNDEGWETVFSEWLKISKISSDDTLFVFSVGGGNKERDISVNLITAIVEAQKNGASVVGVVGKDDGYTNIHADACIVTPIANSANITPHSETMQALIWHLIVSHPDLKSSQTKWEETGKSQKI